MRKLLSDAFPFHFFLYLMPYTAHAPCFAYYRQFPIVLQIKDRFKKRSFDRYFNFFPRSRHQGLISQISYLFRRPLSALSLGFRRRLLIFLTCELMTFKAESFTPMRRAEKALPR